jgi:hypothetical protein
MPIRLDKYVELHLLDNPGTDRAELLARLEYAMDAYRRGETCNCGSPICGSSQLGFGCFTCLTGEAAPDDEYEIIVE